MENVSGIGYVVWHDGREMFLGRMSGWYSDVRLAQVYAEPRAARMAISRLDDDGLIYPVPITMTVAGKHVDAGKADEQKRRTIKIDDKPPAAKPPADKPPAKKPA